jgi:large subunit ribosomal protein L25
VEHLVHEVDIDCPAAAVPEKLMISINDLHLHGSIHAKDIVLPAGAKLLSDPDAVVVHCVTPHVVAETTTAAAVPEPGAAEPELIRKEKPAEGEEAAE